MKLQKKDKQLIVIVGPTAIGKTALSIKLAQHLSTEIISADSRQFYQEMSIGTAKPSTEEMEGIKHHFINNTSIHKDYNAGIFEREAITTIENIFASKNKVIMVGGSGLYVDAVCKGLDSVPKKNEAIRADLESKLANQGIEILQQELKKLDPHFYHNTDLNNGQRLVRALEVCISSGKPYSYFRNNEEKERNFEVVKIGLNSERSTVYRRINQRVDQMLENGLLEEVKQLHEYKQLNALQTVGYKELFDFLDGKIETIDEAIETLKRNTRRFAKRQLTWFRKDPKTMWYEPEELNEIFQLFK